MTEPRSPGLGALVLAGGRSARFGRDKLAEPVDGRPLLEHPIAAVRATAPGIAIVVVGAPGAIPTLPGDVRLVHDAAAFEGPLAGLDAGLRALDRAVDHVLVVGGDMPSLVPAVLRLLLARLAADDAVDLVLLADDERSRPLPAAIRRSTGLAATETLLAAGERRLRAVAGQVATVVIPASDWRALDPAGDTLRDVDTPADLPSG